MREQARVLLVEAVRACEKEGVIEQIDEASINLEIPRDEANGDYASNVALVSAKAAKAQGLKPREFAQSITDRIDASESIIDSASIAGPGFINLRLKPEAWLNVALEVAKSGSAVQPADIGAGQEVMVEFVSANPTGPMHVGHGRGAAVGDTIANLLAKTGHNVTREFYINDAGSQVEKLAESVHARYLNQLGIEAQFPEDGYPGEYVNEVAQKLKEKHGEKFKSIKGAFDDEERVFAIKELLELIRNDLEGFGVYFDNWFSESDLYKAGMDKAIPVLKALGGVFEKDGAVWLETSRYGDDKDRVLIKSNKELTYFASDILYHKNKLERGFKRLINVWGADHHGYIPRVKAAIQAMGHAPECLDVLLVQMVNLLRDGKPVAMSKRTGEFVSLKEVMEEVGADAARFTFLLRSHTSHQDFDIELVKKQSSENPVYYVQYAHARISSIFREAESRGIPVEDFNNVDVSKLELEEEIGLAKKVARYAETIEDAAGALEPHRVTHYLIELAGDFHRYYNKRRVLVEDEALRNARFALARAVKTTIGDGLKVIGVSAPEKM